ncbi:hypothetical protein C8Q80DRAFT_1216067 [Daedaleopsis nitida]|nr:hypothetical protein C8Q80DRAFT_1216067 [Daedaleopsis nitida]
MSSLYESLILKLANVADLATQDQGTLTPQAKQALVRSTKEFKDSLKEANDYAIALPGGELSVEEQDELVRMLEELKERKERQLAAFVDKIGRISSSQATVKMEVDSTASTPA